MKQWVKKLTSAFLASLLTVSLNGRACAEPEGDPVPETPPQISEPPLSDDMPAATADDAVTAADDALPAATDELPKVDALPAATDELPKADALPAATDELPKVDALPAATDELPKADAAPAATDELPKVDALPAAADELPKVDALPAAADELPKADALPAATDELPKVDELPKADAAPAAAEELLKVDALPAAADALPGKAALTAVTAGPAAAPRNTTSGAKNSDGSITQLEDGSIVLINHTGTESLEADGDITILAAGLNRVASISGAGKVNIAGTGILLVDSLEGDLDLLTLTDVYDKGSAAVFVKQTDGTYLLVNGAVPGLLDEEYTIDDASLVMPDHSSLLLCGTGAEAIRDDDGNVTEVRYYHGTEHNYDAVDSKNVMEQVGKLTITGAASLTLRKGAALVLENLRSLGCTDTFDHIRYPELAVTDGGTLTVEGVVTGGGFVTVDGNGSSMAGSGTVTASRIIVGDPDALSDSDLTFSDAAVYLNGAGTYQDLKIDSSVIHMENTSAAVSGLQTSGDTTLLLYGGNDVGLGSVEGTLSLRTLMDPSCTVRGDIGGDGTLRFDRGSFILAEGIKLNGVSISMEAGGRVFDHAGVLEPSLPLMHVSPADMTRADQSQDHSIPVAAAWMVEHAERNKLSYTDVIQLGENTSIKVPQGEGGNLVLSASDLQTLIGAYKAAFNWKEDEGFIQIQLLRLNNETLSLDTFYERELAQEAAGDVCLVRILFLQATSYVDPIGPSTQTGTLFTGSGILGGSGAGSVHYGSTSSGDPNGSGDNTGGDNGDSGDPNGSGDNTGGDNGDSGDPNGGGDSNGGDNGDPGDPNGSGDSNGGDNGDPGDPNGSGDSNGGDNGGSGDPNGGDSNGGDNGDSGDPNGGGDNTGGDNGDSGDPSGSGGNNGQTETESDTETVSAHQTATVWVEPQNDGASYLLRAAQGEKTLQTLGGSVSVSMRYELSSRDAGKALYAVFRNADGSFTAVRARYSRMKGELYFETDRLGAFVVVAFDYDGEEFSDAFYAALETLPELRLLS